MRFMPIIAINHWNYRTAELALIEQIELEQINTFIRSHREIGELTFAMVTNEKVKIKN